MQQPESSAPTAAAAPADVGTAETLKTAPPPYSPNPDATPTPQQPAPVTQPPPVVAAAPSAPGPGFNNVLTVTPLDRLGFEPQWIDCPFCQRRTVTRVSKEGTPMQILAGALCCLLCVFFTCIPCLAGWFEETVYYCSQCNNRVAMRPEGGPLIVYAPASLTVPSQVSAGPR